jgi:shikimate dehydrogenase
MDRYAVIGHPIAHSRSPWIHRKFAEQTGESIDYTARLAPLDGFEQSVHEFQEEGGRGLNVTVPFKTQAFKMATQHSERAKQAEAVNTLIWTGSTWRGDNTDGIGLCRDLLYQGFDITDRHILIIGAGGAVQGLLPVLLEHHPRRVTLINRTAERAQTLVSRFQHAMPNTLLHAQHWDTPINEALDGIIQATSTGLQNQNTSFTWPTISTQTQAWCYDLVYGSNAKMTEQWAWNHQLRFADGLGMLVEQAAESFWLWRNRRPETRAVLADLRAELGHTTVPSPTPH